MFIRNNGPRSIKKFDAMGCAKYWFNIEHKQLVDAGLGYRPPKETDPDDNESSLYFSETTLF